MEPKVAPPTREQLQEAWRKFIETGEESPDIVRAEILASWKKCRSNGLAPYGDLVREEGAHDTIERLCEASKDLLTAARPVMESLAEIIKSLGMVIYLTNADGVVLEAMGAGPIWDYTRSVLGSTQNDVRGASFHEKHIGTTAVSIALEWDKPYQTVGGEHYSVAVRDAACSAAPIHDEEGKIVGVLDLTTTREMSPKHPHTLGMVVAAVGVIENQMRLKKAYERSFLMSQYLQATLQTMSTGVIMIDRDSMVSHINFAAEKLLGISISTVSERRIDRILQNNTIIQGIRNRETFYDQEIILKESIGKIRCLVTLKHIPAENGMWMGSVVFLRALKQVQKLVQKVTGLSAQYTFDDILGESEEIKETIKQARIMSNSMANLIITGESGTGKELFAQSIHNASEMRDGPFLAINCAAIPHDLIESELFGYEPGTFTGASRGGKSGKLEMATGGTLFLDEVNAMSLHMQAKLLRVLEEKRFLRLGGNKYFHLEARIIAATNKDLHNEILEGNFRSDLYYRLGVLELFIPPLRERKNGVGFLTRVFIKEISAKMNKKITDISPKALAYLEDLTWPGNVRQLKNWVERGVNLAEGPTLDIEHFPKDDRHKRVNRAADIRPQAFRHASQTGGSLSDMEKNAIEIALEECAGNISEAAKKLGIGRATLYRKLKTHNLILSKTVTQIGD
ncbi:MAG: sigma 54-interacting transcriptional regulator [Pseudomonadota bacterium]